MISCTFFILLVLLYQAVSGSTSIITKTLGDNVILRCEAGDASLRAVEWTRDDQGPSEYVLFYRDGHLETDDQHPSFKDRVQLVDSDLKHGNVSLDLRNVTFEDSGTYECRVAGGGSGRSKRSNIDGPPFRSIRLQVIEPGSESGGPWERQHIIGLTAAGVLLVCSAAVVLFLVRRKKRTRHLDEKSEQSAADKGADGSLLI